MTIKQKYKTITVFDIVNSKGDKITLTADEFFVDLVSLVKDADWATVNQVQTQIYEEIQQRIVANRKREQLEYDAREARNNTPG